MNRYIMKFELINFESKKLKLKLSGKEDFRPDKTE